MKKSLNSIALALVLIVVQACGPKSEKADEETAVKSPAPTATVELTTAEKRARLDKDIALWEEKRRVSLEELAKLSPTYTDAKGKIVFNKAEVEPTFIGGRNALVKYLEDNLVYPQDAKERGLEGAVFVDFIVSADGVVREVVATDATSGEVDQSFRSEAVRVVSSMPKWTPGRQHGKPVDVKYSLPITFQTN